MDKGQHTNDIHACILLRYASITHIPIGKYVSTHAHTQYYLPHTLTCISTSNPSLIYRSRKVELTCAGTQRPPIHSTRTPQLIFSARAIYTHLDHKLPTLSQGSMRYEHFREP
jgi:hypothetical protein